MADAGQLRRVPRIARSDAVEESDHQSDAGHSGRARSKEKRMRKIRMDLLTYFKIENISGRELGLMIRGLRKLGERTSDELANELEAMRNGAASNYSKTMAEAEASKNAREQGDI
jgi:hypothetical protein